MQFEKRTVISLRQPEQLSHIAEQFYDSTDILAAIVKWNCRERPKLGVALVLPDGPLQKELARIWSEVLGIDTIALDDNFFDLGGHSLTAVQMIFKIRQTFGVDLHLQALLQAPVLRTQVRRLEEELLAQADAIELEKVVTGRSVLSPEQREQAALRLLSTRRKHPFAKFEPLPEIHSDPQNRYDQFPLSDIQEAYLIGRSDNVELGNISCQTYSEVDVSDWDHERLESALQAMIERHEMLRGIVLPDGHQQILKDVPRYRIQLMDLSGLEPAAATAELEAVRRQMSQQVRPTDRWPLFDFRISRLDSRRSRLHVSFDLLIADAHSFELFFGELAHLYHNPDAILCPLEVSFRDYLLAFNSFEKTELYCESREYWLKRLPTLPPAPELPLATIAPFITRPEFKRRHVRIDAAIWQSLKARSARLSLTPAGILLAAFAEVIAIWSKNPRFTINLTLFNRLPLHQQVNDIIGDFTSVTLLEVDNSGSQAFEACAKRLQEQLWQDLDQRYFSGVRVMRELTRSQGGGPRAIMPVVFTSLLNLGDGNGKTLGAGRLGQTVYGISQTPQLYLDCIVHEEGRELVLNWDAVDEVFPPGLLDDMFQSYRSLLAHLASDDSSWHCKVDPNWTSIPYGKPMLNQSFHVLTETLAPRPVWVPGQLYIGGIGVAKGYWRDEEKTHASFIEDPATGQRLYRTGDLGRYLPDGNIEFLGREDFQIKLRGYRIELGEIEAAIKAHAGVREAVVVVREDLPGDRRLVGYYVARERQGPDLGELLSHVKEKLPAYMIPNLVKLDALPRTTNGKLDRAALPAPERTLPQTGRAFAAPRTQVEQQLADIFAEILGIEKLGIRDNFFDLGGHSLQVTQAISRIRRAFQVQIPLARFYQMPTVEGLALEVVDILAKAKSLKDIHVVPTQVEALSETLRLPMNGNGDRRALPAPGQADNARVPGFLAARDDLEAHLTKICEEILGIPTIGVQHNFFELGAQSLLVARLLARIEREFGRRLTFASVYAAPTIEQLAALLRNSSAPTRFTQLFPIQPAGSKPPLFCIGVTIGGGFFYQPLSQHLGIEQPILGVQLDQSVVDQLHMPYAVEELAGYMVQAIREQQPQGPYFLGGFCNNGTLVYETARQLLKQGYPVALLAIFDARNHAYFRHHSNGRRISRLWKRVPFHLQELRQRKIADACRYIGVRLKALWQTVRSNAGDLFNEIRSRRSVVRLTDLEQIFSLALEKYEPKPYPGRVVLFRAETKSDEALSGWRDVMTGSVEMHDVSGNHMGMFFDPHVNQLASRLATCIDKASEFAGRDVHTPHEAAVNHPRPPSHVRA